MSAHTDRHSQGHGGNANLALAGLILVIVAIGAVDLAVRVGAKLGHWRHMPPASPNTLFQRLADHKTRWPTQATPVLIAEGVIILALVAFCAVLMSRSRRGRRQSDRAAPLMRVTDRDSPLTQRHAQSTAARFGVQSPGLLVARSVATGQPLYCDWAQPRAINAVGSVAVARCCPTR